jgi:hypothetical protein
MIAHRDMVDRGSVAALNEQLDRAVRQLQQLQDRRKRADRRMRLSAFIARSSAMMERSRPTNSGITMCG